jgi:ABC-type uncharacterized transport system substrate-binding protein
MKAIRIFTVFIIVLCANHLTYGATKKARIFVVSSYHPEYLWSQDTHRGVCAALLDFGFLDDEGQVREYTKNDYVESSKAVVKKAWMDTKRKSSRKEIAATTARIVKEIEQFKPDLILLGDDNAANYIGNQFIDTEIPIVFWGINGLPLKYGLLDSLKKPGHNVTGIYQAGYLKENVEYLKKLVPSIKTLAILSDDSPTGRSKAKALEKLAVEDELPIKLTRVVLTNSLSEWKSEALKLREEADAFFVLNHNTLKDEQGNHIDQLEIGAWYLSNIKKPDCSHEKQFAQEGILLVVDDSGFKQGYEAVKTAYLILEQGEDPGQIPVRAPERGPVIVNRQRAKMLGIDLSNKGFVEEFIDRALALEKYAK